MVQLAEFCCAPYSSMLGLHSTQAPGVRRRRREVAEMKLLLPPAVVQLVRAASTVRAV